MRSRSWLPLVAILCTMPLLLAGECGDIFEESAPPPAPETGVLALGDFDARQLASLDWLVRFTDRSHGQDVRKVRLVVRWEGREIDRRAVEVAGNGDESVIWEQTRGRFDVSGAGPVDDSWVACQQLLDVNDNTLLPEEQCYELEINS